MKANPNLTAVESLTKTWELIEMPNLGPSPGLEFLPWGDGWGHQSDVQLKGQECSCKHNSGTERSFVQSQRCPAKAV